MFLMALLAEPSRAFLKAPMIFVSHRQLCRRRAVVKGSVGASMVIEGRTTIPSFALGRRCVRCSRYLFWEHRPRPETGRGWSHAQCDGLSTPDEETFIELAHLLIRRAKWH